MAKKLTIKEIQLKDLEEKIILSEGLPHLYGPKMYKWQKDYFDSVDKKSFICAANQIGKSTVQQRKMIDWATNVEKWPVLWKKEPRQFWMLYPDKNTIDQEMNTKIIPEVLPKGEFMKSKRYGWSLKRMNGYYNSIVFNNGLIIYLKTYSQDASNLQGSTVDAVFCDEELPYGLYNEINSRLIATNGYFSMVFTATLGQDEWRRTIEGVGDKELFKGAFKRQVSMYDCLEYWDGTKTHWTRERIKEVEASCATQLEIDRRVYGRFVIAEGLRYPSFSTDKNVIPPHPIDFKTGHIYAGVDPGSGGDNHPSAITFVWVDDTFSKALVFKGWRGDGIETTASDTLEVFRQMKGQLSLTGQYYDYHSRDFFTIASRVGEPFQAADKFRDKGDDIINTLLKSGAMKIFDIPELGGLVSEFLNLRQDVNKRVAVDDFIDSLRYAISRIPFDWEKITKLESEETRAKVKKKNVVVDMRKAKPEDLGIEGKQELDLEFDFWNDTYVGI